MKTKTSALFEREILLSYSTTQRAYETADRLLRNAEADLMVAMAAQRKIEEKVGGKIWLFWRKSAFAIQVSRSRVRTMQARVEEAQRVRDLWEYAAKAVRRAVGSVPTTLKSGSL